MQIDLSRGRRFWPGVVAGLLAFGFGSQGLAQKAPDPEAAGRVALEMHRSLQALDDGVLSMSRDRWDPQYVADQVGPEPGALVAWMRDNMLWSPYAGALRGPEGALMDRRVNSLDGALLLARLLELAGHEVRIGTADLDAAGVAALLEPSTQTGAEGPAPMPAEPSLAETAELYEISPETVARGLDPSAATAAQARQSLLEAVGTQTQALLERLPRPKPAADSEARIRAGLARHYWAQYRRGGNWVDADWMAPTGKAPAQAAASFGPSQIPEDLLHRVRVGLVIEQVKDGRALEQTLFAQEYRPARGEGRKLTLTHMPMDWPADWPATTAADIQTRLRAAFATQREWWPMLAADGEAIGPVSVRADGDINPDPKPNTNPFLPIGVSLAGEMLKVADALRMGDEGSAETLAEGLGPKPQGEWTAEWLEFVLEAPGAPPRTVRRAVFDLIGPAARARGEAGAFKIDDVTRAHRALRAMSEIEVAVLSAAPPPEYLLYQGATAVLANRPVLDEIAADPFGKVPANIMDLMGRMQPLPGALEGFAAARLAANPFAEAVYQDRPLVVARHNYYQREAASGDFLAVQAMDIVDAGVGVDPYADADPFLVRLAQGVADANAEAVVLGGEPQGNAAAALAASRPEDWMLLKPFMRCSA